MRYIGTFGEGTRIADMYLCKGKQIALTKNGKEYGNLVMQDKTGTTDAKVQDLGSPRVRKSETMDYVHMEVGVTLFQNSLQLNMRRVYRAQEGEYVETDYLPVSKKDIRKMYEELLGYIRSVRNPYPQKLLCGHFVEDAAFAKAFRLHSATKTVHHGFVGGSLGHTLSVIRLYDYCAGYYPMINRDLLLTAATSHDIDKTRELLRFPKNDYTDDGQFLGHIVIGTKIAGESICSILGFPEKLATELKHCIPVYHGELEYGSPKKLALLETLALNFADDTGAKMETMIETLQSDGDDEGWLGYNRLLEFSIRKTTEQALRLNNKRK